MRKHILKFYVAVFCLAIGALFYALEVYMIKFIFDDLLTPVYAESGKPDFGKILQNYFGNLFDEFDRESLFILIPVVLVVIFFLKGIFNFFGKYYLDAAGLLAITDLRDSLYEKLLHQGQDFFSFYPTGTLISRLLNDIERMKTAVSEKLTEISKALFQLVALLVSAFSQDYKLTFISLITIPLVVYPVSQFSKKLRRVSRKSQEEMAILADLMKETLSGISIVQMFRMEEKESERYRNANNKLFKVNMKATRVMALTTPLMEFIGGIAIAGILFYGHFKIGRGEITLGTFSAFLATLYAMYVPIKKLSQANNIVQQAVAAAERSVELLEYRTSVTEKENAKVLPPFSDKIVFEKASFAYSRGSKVLDGIDLTIPKGTKIALVGPSGAGKTTLASLIPRLFDVTEGSLKIDGFDVRDITLKSLRSQIGVVTQDTVLFNLTVKENICYGNEDVPMEKVVEAAKRAMGHDFIMALPEGYQTNLGEGGSALSGGQRQRIAIARAILNNPPILILDEATSSLDAESEYAVSEALKELMKGRTTIVIAHRLATVVNADLIVVIDEGKIVESGKHDELLRKNGLYAQLCEKEFRLALNGSVLKNQTKGLKKFEIER